MPDGRTGDDGAEGRPAAPWFNRGFRPPSLLLFRINRRPREQLSIGATGLQPPVLDHLQWVLLEGSEVITGRRHQRRWLVGNVTVGDLDGFEHPVLTGRVGFLRERQRARGEFQVDRGWDDEYVTEREGVYAPFLFDPVSRVLAVVKHPEFESRPIMDVFTRLMQRGEDRLDVPEWDWAAEPILDETDFFRWLERTAVVERVTFVAVLPNPDAIEGHEFINHRLDELNADRIEEKISSKKPTGLQDVDEDPQAQGFVESARQGFGFVTAAGHNRGGRRATFDQRKQLATEPLRSKPGSWSDLVRLSAQALLMWLDRRQDLDDTDHDGDDDEQAET